MITELLTKENLLTCMIFVLGIGILIGFFRTKSEGYGPFNTSTLVINVIVIVTALFFSQGMISEDLMSNMIFAVIGFAAGIFTGKKV